MPLLMSSWVVVSLVAFHEISFLRGLALEGTLAEESVHKGADIEADLGPERLVVRLKNDPLSAAIEALLQKERGPAHRDVFPFRRQAIVAFQRARAPDTRPAAGIARRQLMPERIELAVFRVS